MENKKNEIEQYDEVNTALDKLIQLKKAENNPSLAKKCFLVTVCITIIIVSITLCIMLYNNNFSIENLISLLLAFFSIFISVFFYFKADEASNRFYETSYDFMKDVSVTLGKIEERFGEKLNSLNDKVSHLSVAKEEKTEELETAEDNRQKMIDDLMKKAKLDDKQKEEYMNKLRTQDRQISTLQQQLHHLKRIESNYLNREIDISDIKKILDNLAPKDKKQLVNSPPFDWDDSLKDKLNYYGILDEDEEITPFGRNFLSYIF